MTATTFNPLETAHARHVLPRLGIQGRAIIAILTALRFLPL